MDLSKILSPALEEEERPLRESNRGWSADELQCAVAILQDFQQPCVEPPEKAQHDVCDTNDAKYFVKHEQKEEDKVIKRAIDDNGRVHQEGRRNTGIAGQQQTSLVDSMSKLDLLVEADAIIKHHRSKTPTDDKPQHMRSGVWSRAEEEYAAALVAYFLKGLLDLPEGVTLRKFVAEKLCCNRRRVSMKLGTGSLAGQKIPKKVGASVFVAADPPPSNEQRQEIESALKALRGASFDSGLWNSARNYDEGEDHNNQQHKLLKLHEDDHDSNESRPFNKLMRKKKASLRPKRGKPTIIRTGFESPEEEEFVTAMVEYFVDGSLDLPEGTKLVRYLCQQLGCTPMQLSMKLAPRRTGERKFPDNVGSIRYMRKVKGGTSLHDDEFPEELFEVESRITELRLAHEEAHKNIPSPEATPIKRERKVSMASVSSSGTASSPSASPVRSFQRSGPWSHDEEVYAAALIEYFFKGVLEISEGTTLRAFLSSRLCCNPMRISKKLASECIAEIRIPKKLGSSAYVRNAKVTMEEQAEAEAILLSLQRVYMPSKTATRGSILGSKRPRRSCGSRPPSLMTTIGMDLDATGSESDSHSAVASYACEKSPMKLQKTHKIHSPAQEGLRQRFQVAHMGPALVVPAPLKQQLA